MESSKLKNIVLIILILTNCLLLLILGARYLESRRYGGQVLADTVDLLAQQGISLDPQLLPQGDFSPALDLERGGSRDRAVFTALLGEDTAVAQRGLSTVYSSPLGRAEARSDGSFTLTLEPEAAAPFRDRDQLPDALRQVLSFTGQVVEETENTVTLRETWEGTPIFSCSVTLTYEGGDLLSISGTRLTGQPAQSASAETPLSLPTLLLRFRSGLVESGDVCSAILGASQGYLVTSGGRTGLRLTPVLRLETDANTYYVNAFTGELSRA